MRISLHPGVWIGSVSLWVSGGLALATAILPEQINALLIGRIAILVGILLFVWGIKWDGDHWWTRLPKVPRRFWRVITMRRTNMIVRHLLNRAGRPAKGFLGNFAREVISQRACPWPRLAGHLIEEGPIRNLDVSLRKIYEDMDRFVSKSDLVMALGRFLETYGKLIMELRDFCECNGFVPKGVEYNNWDKADRELATAVRDFASSPDFENLRPLPTLGEFGASRALRELHDSSG